MSYQESIDYLYQIQKASRPQIAQLTIKARKQFLKKLKEEILAHQPLIEEALFSDLRKHPTEAVLTEIFPLITEIKDYLKNLESWAEEKSVPNSIHFIGADAKLMYEPKGMVLILSPWNYPFQIPIMHLIAAVAAGNVVLIKPSEFTPNINKVLRTIIEKVFEPKHVAVVEGAVDEATYLLAKKFDHIHFTGSPKVGKIVMAAAAQHLASCTLELGGKSPFVIDDKINLNFAIKKLMLGKFINLGQTCIAPDYVLISKQRKDELIQKLIAKIKSTFSEDISTDENLARIINLQNHQRLVQMLDDAKSKGATVDFGGNYSAEDLYFSPTIVSNLNPDSRLLQEEIFGPIIPIVCFDSKEEMAAFINKKEKPLVMYVMSNQKAWRNFFEQNTSSGALLFNDTMSYIMHPNLPFGGVNNSGMGQATGKFGFYDFSHQKPVLRSSRIFSLTRFMRMPYQTFVKKLLSLLMK
ncbi:aldehyde dehydrogenase family protein [Vaginella massiliensis]|uniref:aldehyde dehydrogenase family protein n=1 Tax=Vaginella massiliensis TaxID=1816680 RepID=UPI00083849BC|nr:aldehyde dehydrogenase family protein [Vaginella massiliensis]